MTLSKVSIGQIEDKKNTRQLLVQIGQIGGDFDASLGRVANNPSASLSGVFESKDRRGYRLWLQDGIAEVMQGTGERVCQCLRRAAPIPGSLRSYSHIKLLVSRKENKARFGNLIICGSIWACPWCASRISEDRRQRLAEAVRIAYERGYGVYLLSYTFRHQYSDKIKELLPVASKAFSATRTRRDWLKWRQEYGYLADIRDLEVTVGDNGFHPHFHQILILDHVLTENEQKKLEKEAKKLWVGTLARAGLSATLENGLKIIDDYGRIAEYLTKYGKMPEERPAHSGSTYELTYQTSKGDFDNRNMWQVAEDYQNRIDRPNCTWQISGRLFREYALAFKGRRQLEPSRSSKDGSRLGFWELFGLKDWDEDQKALEALVDQPFSDEELLLEIPLVYWWLVVKHGVRGEVLQVALQTFDHLAVWGFIMSLLPSRAPPRVLDCDIVDIALYERHPQIEYYRDLDDYDRLYLDRYIKQLQDRQELVLEDLTPKYMAMVNAKLGWAADCDGDIGEFGVGLVPSLKFEQLILI